MTKIEQLIKELCPNGVEYKKLGEVATISRGGSFQKKDFCEDGVPCIHYGQIYTRYGLFADKTLTFISEDAAKKQKYAVKNDIVMAVTSENIDDVCKCVAWLGDDEIAVSGHTAIIHHTLNPKYLCYYFHTAMFYAQKKKLAHGTKVIEVTPDKLTDITIPVPPIEIQVEIVKILDEYSTSVTALQQELENELTARKKQYEYYRDLLLDFGVHGGGTSECEWRTLGEIFDIRNGYTPSKSNADYWENGTVPWFRMDDIRENGRILSSAMQKVTMQAVKNKPFPANSIIISTSATIGEHALITVDFMSNQRFSCLSLKKEYKSKFNMMFVFYYCFILSKYCSENLNQSSFASVDMSKFYSFSFPIIPIEEQERIVSILDRFDKLCNDISEGLPAEIEARRKQYEYYRDKLLSFEEVRT